MLRHFAALDDLFPVALLGVLHAVFAPTGALAPWAALPLSVGLGLALGQTAHWLFPKGDDPRHNFLVLLGVISLGAGAAALLGLSPLFVTALAGNLFVNFSGRKESAYALLARQEHNLYAAFLLVSGMLFHFDWGAIVLLVPVYLGLRGLGKIAGGWLGWRFFLSRDRISPWIGAGLLFQGGMALAMAVSFSRGWDGPLARQVTTAIVVAVVINDLVGPLIAGALLGRRGN